MILNYFIWLILMLIGGLNCLRSYIIYKFINYYMLTFLIFKLLWLKCWQVLLIAINLFVFIFLYNLFFFILFYMSFGWFISFILVWSRNIWLISNWLTKHISKLSFIISIIIIFTRLNCWYIFWKFSNLSRIIFFF